MSIQGPEFRTHLGLDRRLCGQPLAVEEGSAVVGFEALPEMAADDRGLVMAGTFLCFVLERHVLDAGGTR